MLNLSLASRILDFGCGSGDLLLKLRYFGFTNLTGVDAFIEGDVDHDNGVHLRKGSLEALEAEFDLVMLHHSFEHLSDPALALSKIKSIISRRGYVLIRMPVVSYAWKKYGRHWAQLDPPRHFFLFSESGFRGLASNCGFSVEKVVYDSFAYYQFWASELYMRGVPLLSDDNSEIEMRRNLFGSQQMVEWEAEAKRLNSANQGDQACYYLKPILDN